MSSPPDPLDAGLAIAHAFESHHISYAIGGALAYGLWGVPRATIDVDMTVFVDDEGLDAVVEALSSLGIVLDVNEAREVNRQRGMFTAHFGPFRVDLFTPSIGFYREAERTRVRRTVEGQQAWFLSAESLAVFKLLFFRAKDLVDLQRLIAVQGAKLDHAYVRQQIVSMMGEGDERVTRWDELVAAHLGAG